VLRAQAAATEGSSFGVNSAGSGTPLPFVVRRGVRIHYEVEGEGPPVVNIPGLGGNTESWSLMGNGGAFPHHRLVLVDPRGHGKSGKPKDRMAHRIEEYRDDVLAVLDAEHSAKTVVWGISDGSKIGFALADAYPDRVSALIDHDGVEGGDLCDPPERERRLSAARMVRAKSETFLRELSAAEGYSIPTPLFNQFLSEDSEMVALELEEWTHWKGPTSVLPRLKPPLLMLLNGKREQSEISRLRRLAGEQAETHVLPDAGHMKICMEPYLTRSLIRGFLSRVQP